MISLDDVWDPLRIGSRPFFPLLGMTEALASYGVSLEADYQRGHVWTTEQQMDFVGHLLVGGAVQCCVMNRGPTGDLHPAEVVDGKQRITACCAWSDGHIPAWIPGKGQVWAKDLNQKWQTKSSCTIGLELGIVLMTRRECLRLYLKLNSAGVVHEPDELERVRRLLEKES
jgi:hypothetical protein